ILGYFVADWFFLPPRHEISVFTLRPTHLLGFSTFVATGLIIAAFSEVAKRAQLRAELRQRDLEQEIIHRQQAERLAHESWAKLEVRVPEPTAELAQANKELEAFSYSVSHDLRAPLRAISSFAQLIKDDYQGKLGVEADEMLQIIIHSTQRMDRLIQDLLSL